MANLPKEHKLERTTFTLDPENIAWLRAQAEKSNYRSSSAYLNRLLTAYRKKTGG